MASRKIRKAMKKYTKFTIISPFGYDFDEVEEAISDYKEAIAKISELLDKKDSEIRGLKNENNRLVDELTNSRIQLESFAAPMISAKDSLEVLNDFSGGEFDIPEEEIDDNLKEELSKPKIKNNNKKKKNNRPKEFTIIE